jgi:capsular exopolysaccharide synthesis family protein
MTENKITKDNASEDFFRLQDLWIIFLTKWYWFVGTVLVALAIAVLYLLITPPEYTRTASVLIKDDPKSGMSTGDMSNFSDLGFFKSKTNINNELLTIQSPSMMKEVVSRLNLDTEYTIRTGLRMRNLYKVAPVTVTFKTPDENVRLGFDITLQPQNQFVLSHFSLLGDDLEGEITGTFFDSIATPVGVIVLLPTPRYSDVWHNVPIHFRKYRLQSTANAYAQKLSSVLADIDATVIDLSIEDASIQKAEDIINTLINVYNESWIKEKNKVTVSTSEFITNRLVIIENELGNVDENISNYKSKNLIPDLEVTSSLYVTQSAENRKELNELNNRLSAAQYIRRSLLDDKSSNQLLPANSGIGTNNIELERQINEYNSKLLLRNNLLTNSSEKNPLVMDLNQSLAAMGQAIVRSIDNLIVALNTQISNMQQMETTTTKQIASNPNQAKYLLSVGRQQKVKEELYLYLLQKREENELSQAFTAYNTRIIMPPLGSLYPTSPRKIFVLMVAFILGMFLPAVVIFLKETLNMTLRGRKDLEGMTIPFLGEIPLTLHKKKRFLSRKVEKNIRVIVIKEKNRNIVNEAFRVVRTNFEFMTGKGNVKVVMVSSLNIGSGKTFITANIATSLAIKGRKTLIIDLDMRKASLSTAYLNSPKPGIADYLSGLGSLSDIIIKSQLHKNVDVIPVGTIPPNPAELLADERMEQILNELRTEYDYIFIDCPPVEIVADASIITELVDMTMFIVRAGLLDRRMLPEIENFYISQKYKNMSLILNATTAATGRYGYHKYGYNYGYHYGYADK